MPFVFPEKNQLRGVRGICLGDWARYTARMSKGFLLWVGICLAVTLSAAPKPKTFPLQAKRILFMGDSITHAGHYVAWIEMQLRLSGYDPLPELINLGLPSETACGLSEPDHPWPRPNAHERLGRALAKTQPDVVVACYGMNDGIYYPFSKKRFMAYQDGIGRLIKKVHAANAKLVLMTPPAFDPLPLKKKGKLRPVGAEKYAWFAIYENYDAEVLRPYSRWIMQQHKRVEMAIDLHTPVINYVAARRRTQPDFTMSPDGVHVNPEGHRVLARAILGAWGVPPQKSDAELLQLVTRRQKLLHDAWLSHVGHKRPGVQPGVPLHKARAQAAELEQQINLLLKKRGSASQSQ